MLLPECENCEFWRNSETESGCACPFSPRECLEKLEKLEKEQKGSVTQWTCTE